MKKYIIIILLCIVSYNSFSQTNLIYNYDFEDLNTCDGSLCPVAGTGGFTYENMVTYWVEKADPWTIPDKRRKPFNASPGSPDLLCDNGTNKYARGVEKENICQELREEVKGGIYYYISYKIKATDNGFRELGFAFTKKKPRASDDSFGINLSKNEFWVFVPPGNSTSGNQFIQYSETFMAREDAKWITFASPEGTVGYSIDDIILYEVAPPTMQTCCPYNLTISNTTFSSNDEIKANNKITVDGPSVVISNNSQVIFSAGNEVELTPGIDVNPGSGYVLIENQPCTGNENYTPSVQLLPNVFTPDGDGQNDEFCVVISDATEYDFQVYSPSGSLVKNTVSNNVQSNLICLWDGICGSNTPACSNGSELPEGTYFFSLSLKWCNNQEIFTGYLSLFRGDERKGQIDSIASVNTLLNNEIIQSKNKNASDNNYLNKSSFQIVPNPNNGVFTIVNDNSKSNIIIRNVIGEVIFKLPSEKQNQIDLSNQAKGVYFITLIGEGINETKKVIIE